MYAAVFVGILIGVIYVVKRKLSGLTALPVIPFSLQYQVFLSPIGYYITVNDETEIRHSKTTPIEYEGACGRIHLLENLDVADNNHLF